MKGNSNSQGRQFEAKLVGEITQQNKNNDSHFVKAKGQTVNTNTYPDISNMFPLTSTNLGASFSYVGKAKTGELTAASVSGYIYAFNMHIYQNGNILTSLDGKSFVVRVQGSCRGGFGYNGVYCAVGDSSATGVCQVTYSSNGVNWTSQNIYVADDPIHIAYGNGIFLLAEVDQTNPNIYSSTSPTGSWVQRDSCPRTPYGLGFAGSRFICVSYNTSLGYISSDGNNWESINMGSTIGSVQSINSGDGLYMAFNHSNGSDIFTGGNEAYDPVDTLRTAYYSAGSGNIFIAISNGYSSTKRYISVNSGETWQEMSNFTISPELSYGQAGNLLGYGNGQLILFVIQSSTDTVSIYRGSVYLILPNYIDDAYIRLIPHEGGGIKLLFYFFYILLSLLNFISVKR